MLNASKYTTTEKLRDGRAIEIRALSSEDEPELIAGVGRLSAQSMYRRFFGAIGRGLEGSSCGRKRSGTALAQ